MCVLQTVSPVVHAFIRGVYWKRGGLSLDKAPAVCVPGPGVRKRRKSSKEVKKKPKAKKTKSKSGQSGKKKKASSVSWVRTESSKVTGGERRVDSFSEPVILCVPSQSEDDFLDESDFDDLSVHSASVLSDALRATTKKKSKSGRKKKKSMLAAC